MTIRLELCGADFSSNIETSKIHVHKFFLQTTFPAVESSYSYLAILMKEEKFEGVLVYTNIFRQ